MTGHPCNGMCARCAFLWTLSLSLASLDPAAAPTFWRPEKEFRPTYSITCLYSCRSPSHPLCHSGEVVAASGLAEKSLPEHVAPRIVTSTTTPTPTRRAACPHACAAVTAECRVLRQTSPSVTCTYADLHVGEAALRLRWDAGLPQSPNLDARQGLHPQRPTGAASAMPGWRRHSLLICSEY